MQNRTDIDETSLNINPGSHLHFIGIGGSSMSGIAEIALSRGYRVTGSDRADSEAIGRLRRLGAEIAIGHAEENLSEDCALVIYTLAISDDNPEYQKASRLGIPTIERGAFLGALAAKYAHVTAVSGTHGKTTTTSMLASVLIESGKDPNIHLGGIVSLFGSNVRTGQSNLFVTEACEYHDNFLHIKPEIGIVLNVEAEHLDYFGTTENLLCSFRRFITGIRETGLLIVCADSASALSCARAARCRVATYSILSPNAPYGFVNANGAPPVHHYYAAEMSNTHRAAPEDDPGSRRRARGAFSQDRFSITAGYSFVVCEDGAPLHKITMHVPGKHNVSNALAAIAAARELHCSEDGIAEGLRVFTGAGRRFDVAGTYNGAFIINDYAHHPTEIRATIEAAHANCSGKIWSVFQPHTYSRAQLFQNEFCEALKESDHVIVTDIYAAREPFTDKISAQILCDRFTAAGLSALYLRTFEEIASYIRSHVAPDDAVLLLGAGTVNKIAPMILA